MGLPWPPPWLEGVECGTCAATLFGNRTPIFVYAFAQNIVKCPGVPPGAPSPNHVIQMTQVALQPCRWVGHLISGIYDYMYVYYFALGSSFMVIYDISAMPVFEHAFAPVCCDSFVNQLTCGPPVFSGFSGGTVDCFW